MITLMAIVILLALSIMLIGALMTVLAMLPWWLIVFAVLVLDVLAFKKIFGRKK